MRASHKEMREVGRVMALKLNKAKGPVIVMIPLKGFCYHNKEGGSLYDGEGNLAYISSLKENISGVKVIDIDAHINDPEFAISAAKALEGLLSE